ncbi:MAG: Mu-like prophage major head subunit gpT family protein [Deltaproteobacteria bacterium]|nr:Mu-like prophage major head subunit gpT family protein [Deltaproteobacteria bacterium]
MPINTGNFAKLLYPGLNTIYGHKYNEFTKECSQIFETRSSKRAYEEDIGVTGFGLAAVKSEGNAGAYDTEQQGFLTRYNHVVYSLGFIITEEMMDDDQYDTVGQRRTEGLAFSQRQTEETVAANILNRGFNTSFSYGDGSSLIASAGGGGSASRPNVSGGTWTNGAATAGDLSEATLEQALIDIANYEDDRGKKIQVNAKQLIIANGNQFNAERILGSTLRSGTADNDANAILSMGMVPKVVLNHYLTDADAWFIQTDMPNGFIKYERKAMSFAMDNDFDTSNAKFKSQARYSFGNTDQRSVWGNPGA